MMLFCCNYQPPFKDDGFRTVKAGADLLRSVNLSERLLYLLLIFFSVYFV